MTLAIDTRLIVDILFSSRCGVKLIIKRFIKKITISNIIYNIQLTPNDMLVCAAPVNIQTLSGNKGPWISPHAVWKPASRSASSTSQN